MQKGKHLKKTFFYIKKYIFTHMLKNKVKKIITIKKIHFPPNTCIISTHYINGLSKCMFICDTEPGSNLESIRLV